MKGYWVWRTPVIDESRVIDVQIRALSPMDEAKLAFLRSTLIEMGRKRDRLAMVLGLLDEAGVSYRIHQAVIDDGLEIVDALQRHLHTKDPRLKDAGQGMEDSNDR